MQGFKGQFTTAQVGEVERRRREDRDAEGVECGEGFYFILSLNMVGFGAFWMVFLQFS